MSEEGPAGSGEPPGSPSASTGAGTSLVSLDAVREAAGRLTGVALRTPLVPGTLSGGEDVWLKCESLQHGGAFKIRGAYNFTALLPEVERERGLVTYSSGNHAQGVAAAARAFGVPAVIVMPEDAPRVKVEGTRSLGGEVVREGHTTTERRARAEEIARETGATIVPPFDHPDIVAGQGTTALEALEQLQEAAAVDSRDPRPPGLVVVPIGGGGLLSGHAVVLRALHPDCRVVGVEPEGAASMKRSLEAGEPVSLDHVDTIADGLKPVRPGDLTFRHVRALVDDVVTVSEEALVEGLRWCFRRRLVVEPSGGAALAALLSGAVDPPDDGATLAVVSGGNVDPDAYARWVAAG